MIATETAPVRIVHLAPHQPLPTLPDTNSGSMMINLKAYAEPDSHLMVDLLTFVKRAHATGINCVHIVNASPAVDAALRFMGIPRVLAA